MDFMMVYSKITALHHNKMYFIDVCLGRFVLS